MRPMTAPTPSSDDTGSIRPQNWTAGRMVRIAVPKMAAIWLRMNDEISSPIAVDDVT